MSKKSCQLVACQKRSKTIGQRIGTVPPKVHICWGAEWTRNFGLHIPKVNCVTILWVFLINLRLFTSIFYAMIGNDRQRASMKRFHYNLKPPNVPASISSGKFHPSGPSARKDSAIGSSRVGFLPKNLCSRFPSPFVALGPRPCFWWAESVRLVFDKSIISLLERD